MVQAQNVETEVTSKSSRNLSFFFGMTYLCHGLSCAQFGLMAQPIQYFLLKGLHFSAAQSSTLMASMMLPWVIKPVYGLMSDFIPIFGYRRKSYLAIANLVASFSFGAVALFATLDYKLLVCCLIVAATCMAVSTALLVGTAAERGRADGRASNYFGIQEIAYYTANIVAAIVAGYVCQTMEPLSALKFSAAIAFIPSFIVSALSLVMLQESRVSLNLAGFRSTQLSLIAALKSRALWILIALALLWNFLPCFGVPLYYFESNKLHFSQENIGRLAAYNAAGMLTGSICYTLFFKRLSMTGQLFTTTALLIASVASFCLLSSMENAMPIEIFHGFANVVAILSVYIIGARLCPRRIEITVLAVLVAVRNVATDGATFVGGQLYSHAFHESFIPVVLTSCVAPSLSLILAMALLREVQTIEKSRDV